MTLFSALSTWLAARITPSQTPDLISGSGHRLVTVLLILLACGYASSALSESAQARHLEYHIPAHDLIAINQKLATVRLCRDCPRQVFSVTADTQWFNRFDSIEYPELPELLIKRRYALHYISIDHENSSVNYFVAGGRPEVLAPKQTTKKEQKK